MSTAELVGTRGIGEIQSDAYQSEAVSGIPLPEWETMSPLELRDALDRAHFHEQTEVLMRATTMIGFDPEHCKLQQTLLNAKRELDAALGSVAQSPEVSARVAQATQQIRGVFNALSFEQRFPREHSYQEPPRFHWREFLTSFVDFLKDLPTLFRPSPNVADDM